MATFKVGQRVKKVAFRRRADYTSRCVGPHAPIDATATITGYENGEISVMYDHYRSDHFTGEFTVLPYMLAPLTDGETDAWAADAVRKLVKPEPVAPARPVKERVTEAEMYAAIDEMLRRNIP